MTQYYFAFGSNMADARIRARLPHVKRIGVAKLPHYRLDFDMLSLDGSGKCTIHPSEGNQVYGVVWQLAQDEIDTLTAIEGPRYDVCDVEVLLDDNTPLKVFCYIGNTLDKVALPFDWYVEHVYRGAVEAKLPEHYISEIKNKASIGDFDSQRSAQEKHIYTKDS